MNLWAATLLSLSFYAIQTHTSSLLRNPVQKLMHTDSPPRPSGLGYGIRGDEDDSASTKTQGFTLFDSSYSIPTDLGLQKFTGGKQETLDGVELSFLPTGTTDRRHHETTSLLPLVISPKENSSLQFLTQFLQQNKDWVNEQILQYGAVLFRGFDIDTAAHVETAARAFEPNLHNSYRGTSPRLAQPDSEYVFSAAEVPSHFPIAQHLEMSFLQTPPKKIFFSALRAPKTVGGETALADFRQVYRDIPRKLREKLASKKLRYTRTHQKEGARFLSHDVAAMQSWPELFGTSNKAEIEQIARKENMPLRWEGRKNETFVSEFTSEPFQLHPESREPVWFNHAQVFHWTSFPAELFFAWKRTKEWRFLFRAIAVGMKSFVQYGLLRQKMALQVDFGDGTPISVIEMHQIRKAVHKNMVFNRWQQGDLLIIDNFSTSHGRQPTYDSGRKVVVAWSEPTEKTNEPVFADIEGQPWQ